ncbi:MAG TPA: thioesterase family protein [Syntrophales bacterium]|nr:thioesterase family protein [Syntrophales bacterium]HRT71061.1 thioesterase family protein [Syntrophales bacterium]
MEHLVEGYPVVIKFPVQWGDMDAFQHVNNVSYFRYLENARLAYFESFDIIGFMAKSGVGPILAATSCVFKTPLKYPDTVLVAAKVTTIKEDRFTMDYRIVSTKQQKVAAEADSVIVTFDYRANKKVPIPEEFRRLITAVENSACHV